MLVFLLLYLMKPFFLMEGNTTKKILLSSNLKELKQEFDQYEKYEIDSKSNFWEIIKNYDSANIDTMIIHSNNDIHRFDGDLYLAHFQLKFINIEDKFPDYAYFKNDSIFIFYLKKDKFIRHAFIAIENQKLLINNQQFMLIKKDRVWKLSNGKTIREVNQFKHTKLNIIADKKSKVLLKKIIKSLNTIDEEILITEKSNEGKSIQGRYENDNYFFTFNNRTFSLSFGDFNTFQNFVFSLRKYIYDSYDQEYRLSSRTVNEKFLGSFRKQEKIKRNDPIDVENIFLILFFVLFVTERFLFFKMRFHEQPSV